LLAEELVGNDAEAIIRKAIAMAKKGNEVALRLVIEGFCHQADTGHSRRANC
jgi:hypothetical protein